MRPNHMVCSWCTWQTALKPIYKPRLFIGRQLKSYYDVTVAGIGPDPAGATGRQGPVGRSAGNADIFLHCCLELLPCNVLGDDVSGFSGRGCWRAISGSHPRRCAASSWLSTLRYARERIRAPVSFRRKPRTATQPACLLLRCWSCFDPPLVCSSSYTTCWRRLLSCSVDRFFEVTLLFSMRDVDTFKILAVELL